MYHAFNSYAGRVDLSEEVSPSPHPPDMAAVRPQLPPLRGLLFPYPCLAFQAFTNSDKASTTIPSDRFPIRSDPKTR